MKQKYIFITLISFFFESILFGQNLDLKNYSDYSQDFSGSACAIYLGNLNDIDKDKLDSRIELLSDTLTEVKKLTKNNNWLLKKAMNEWDYQVGEVYFAVLLDNQYADNGVFAFVQVNKNNQYTWKAWTVTTVDLYDLEDIFSEKTSPETTTIPSSEEYISGQREIFDWYTSLGLIQTTTCDEPPATVRVDIAIAYKKDDVATLTEITSRTVEIKSFLRRYFNGKTAAELKNTNNEDILEQEIKDGINDKILNSSRIRDVVFMQKDVIKQ